MRKLIALIAIVALWPSVAHAQAGALPDPKDTEGDLDIVVIAYQADGQPGGPPAPLKLTIEIEDAWECEVLDEANGNFLKWNFDTKGGGAWEYSGDFICRDGQLWFDMRSKDGDNYEPLRAKKPNKKTVKVTIPGGFFKEGNKFGMWARSRDVMSSECTEEPCKDRAPNRGRL